MTVTTPYVRSHKSPHHSGIRGGRSVPFITMRTRAALAHTCAAFLTHRQRHKSTAHAVSHPSPGPAWLFLVLGCATARVKQRPLVRNVRREVSSVDYMHTMKLVRQESVESTQHKGGNALLNNHITASEQQSQVARIRPGQDPVRGAK